MIKISDVAAEKGKQILSAEGKSDGGLRIYLAGSSCSGPAYGMDLNEHPAEGDEIIEKNGLKVFVDKTAHEKLRGMEIDFIDDGKDQGFVLKGSNPSSCDSGCSSCG